MNAYRYGGAAQKGGRISVRLLRYPVCRVYRLSSHTPKFR